MKVITIRSQIREVAGRWRKQYPPGGHSYGREKDEIQSKLDALDVETAMPSDVTEIIGNSSWVGPQDCHECGDKFEAVLELGEPDDYDSYTVRACAGCLRKALSLMVR